MNLHRIHSIARAGLVMDQRGARFVGGQENGLSIDQQWNCLPKEDRTAFGSQSMGLYKRPWRIRMGSE